MGDVGQRVQTRTDDDLIYELGNWMKYFSHSYDKIPNSNQLRNYVWVMVPERVQLIMMGNAGPCGRGERTGPEARVTPVCPLPCSVELFANGNQTAVSLNCPN